MLDIRMPIGLMFVILGVLLVAYGATQPPAAYAMALGYNLDVYWGAAMAVFGAGMFAWMTLDPQDKAA
ncbi:MAG: hypothetical protein JWM80_3805 [Cyanobacteria bacterium RYN_339]|nr:hypothetical protein [Cyanobacteria bacterium RYN_339]